MIAFTNPCERAIVVGMTSPVSSPHCNHHSRHHLLALPPMPSNPSRKRGIFGEAGRDTAEALLALRVPRHIDTRIDNDDNEQEDKQRRMPAPALPKDMRSLPSTTRRSRQMIDIATAPTGIRRFITFSTSRKSKKRPKLVVRPGNLTFLVPPPGRPMPVPPKLPKTVIITSTRRSTMDGQGSLNNPAML